MSSRTRTDANAKPDRRESILHEPLEPRLLLSGTTYIVDNLADVVAADGLVTLREAIEAANTNAAVFDAAAGSDTESDIITFDQGLTAIAPIVIHTTDTIAIQDDLEIHGPGSRLLVVDADEAHGVLRVDPGVTVELVGLTVTGGAYTVGAGLYNAGDAILRDVTITRNIAGNPLRPYVLYNGGGIFNESGASLEIIDSLISDNSASEGGGVYSVSENPLSLRGCRMLANYAGTGLYEITRAADIYTEGPLSVVGCYLDGYAGLGDSIVAGDTATIVDSSIVRQSGRSWPYGYAVKAIGELVMTGCTVSENDGVRSEAGMSLTDCRFLGHGGANAWGGSSTIRRCAFLYGADVYNSASLVIADTVISGGRQSGLVNAGEVIIINSQISGHQAIPGFGDGGGIRNHSTSGVAKAVLINCAVVGNAADGDGGGISVGSGVVELYNTVVAGNTAGGVGADIAGEVSTSSSYNFVGVGDGMTGVMDGSQGNQVGSPASPGDPGLEIVLTDGTPVLHPAADSPLIDAGSDALAVDSDGVPLAADMLGRPRVQGAAVEIGAVEGASAAPPMLQITSPASGPWATGHSSKIRWDAVSGPAATVSVYYDTDDVFDGNETYLLEDWPLVSAVDGAEWDTMWQPVGVYRIGVVLTDPDGGVVLSDSVSVQLHHDSRVVYLVEDLSDVITPDGVLTLGEALAATNKNRYAGDAVAGRGDDLDVIRLDASLTGQSLGRSIATSDHVILEGPGRDLLTIEDFYGWSNVYGVDVLIRGMTVKNAEYWSNYGNLSIRDCAFIDGGGENHAVIKCSGFGSGGLEFPRLTIADSLFADNDYWVIHSACDLRISNTVFRDNVNGVRCDVDVRIEDSLFEGNTGSSIYFWGYEGLFLKDCVFRGNGTAVYSEHATAVVDRCVFEGNHGSSGRGVLDVREFTITDSLFRGNSTEYGGAIAGEGRIINSVVVGCRASDGGGIYVDDGDLLVTNSTISGNVATGRGGGIFIGGGALTLDNTIVGLNDAANGNDVFGDFTEHGSLVGVDPRFVRSPDAGADGEWGTADDDYGDLRLAAGSPAIDAGDDAFAIDDQGVPLATDLLANARFVGARVDIGAYEYQGARGDANQDGSVDLSDFVILKQNWATVDATWNLGDFSGDRTVDLEDFVLMKQNWGTAAAAPVQTADNVLAEDRPVPAPATVPTRRRARARWMSRRRGAAAERTAPAVDLLVSAAPMLASRL